MSGNVAWNAMVTPAPRNIVYAGWNRDISRRQLSLPSITGLTGTASDNAPQAQSSNASSSPSSEASSVAPSSVASSSPSSEASSQASSIASSEPSSHQPSSTPSSSPTTTPSSSVEPSSSSSLPPSTSSSTLPSTSSTSTQSSTSQSTSASLTPTSISPAPSFTSLSSSSAQTTITTTFVTDINGVQQTITSAIPTTINSAPSSTNAPQNRAIIAGSVIGGIALIAIVISLVIFTKRTNYRRLRVFGRHQPRSRSMLLAGEDFDDSDPPMTQYRDYPGTPTSAGTLPGRYTPPYRDDHSVRFPAAANSGANTSPHLATLRASESGSIFREDVWPPPGEASRFVDPILATSSQVNLGRIIEDVMGPNSRRTPSPLPQPRPPSYHLRSGSSGSDPFRSTPAPSIRSQQPRQSLLMDDSGVSPITPPKLFVTNPNSTTSPTSPPTSPTPKTKNWLERSPKSRTSLVMAGNESTVSMGEAL